VPRGRQSAGSTATGRNGFKNSAVFDKVGLRHDPT
jgi:hypothetical protein